jgi:hypothetical protein
MHLSSILLFTALTASGASDVVPLTVEEPSGVARKAWPVTAGVPLPPAALRDAQAVNLVGPDGQRLPVQTETLAQWGDGSIRWLLVDCQVDLAAHEKKTLELRFGPSTRRAKLEQPLVVRRQTGRVRFVTGPMQLEIDASSVRLPGDVWWDRNGDGRFDPGEQITRPDSPGVMLTDGQGRQFSSAAQGTPAEIAIEQSGPLRACVRIAGTHRGPEGQRFRYVARVHAFRGQPYVRVFYTLVNDYPDALMAHLRSAELVVRGADAEARCVLNGQPSAGGTLLQVDEAHYRLGTQGAGAHAPGWAALASPRGTVAIGLREFWQNWPKGITCSPGEIRLGICPPLEAGLYDGKPLEEENKLYYYLRGSQYTFKIGVARTHELWATFAPDVRPADELAKFFAAAEDPVLATADPEWACATGALGDVPPADPEKYSGYDRWLERSMAIGQADRDRRREYGMLNYGDWYGERGVNWGNLEYDLAHGLLIQYLRTGDRRFFMRAEQAARHHVDVDVIHATNAHLKNPWGPAPQTGEIWLHCLNHTGGYYEYPRLPVERTYHMGHSTNFGHVWLAGDLEYYYLTGDRRVREVALEAADRMAAHCPTSYGTHIRNLGWPMILVLAAYEATGDSKYLEAAAKNWEVLREHIDWQRGWVVRLARDHCAHGDRRCSGNVPFMEGLTVCALARYHRITGDPDVLRAISVGIDQMIRECYDSEKRMFRYTACPLTKPSALLFLLSAEAMAYEVNLTGNAEHLRILREGLRTALETVGPQHAGKGLAQMIHFTPYALRVLEEGRAPQPVKPPEPLRVSTNFEGGFARVLAIDDARGLVRFSPAGNPERGWPCWWSFRLSGIEPGQTITLELVADKLPSLGGYDPLAWNPARPALCVDGRTWRQFDANGVRSGNTITWQQRVDQAEVRMAWGPPFTPADATALVAQIAATSRHARAFELCRTREGRPVLGLTIEEKSSTTPRFGVWIEARQHAWEIGSSWTCRGLAEWLASDDPRAQSLRRKCAVHLVPIMDVDNAATGNGGKSQKPHDHNRDWSDRPHWPEVRAAQERILAMRRAGQMDLFIDLHDPDAAPRESFYFAPPRETLSERQRRNHARLLEVSRAEITGPIGLRSTMLETGAKYDPQMWQWISKNWVIRNTGDHVVAVTLEVAWNTPASTQEGYLAHGRQLGLALERYFRQDPRK